MNLRGYANDDQRGSFSNRMRSRRFELFRRLASQLERPLSIIDIGGTTAFWEQRGWAGSDEVSVVTVNLEGEERRHENIVPRVGDATDLRDYADKSFDVAFSNSVIEHLFTIEAQIKMAGEVERVARAYWVQTPNFWFPMEPHFHVAGWHWLPERARVAMIRRRACGWRGPCPDPEAARELVREVRLMRRGELEQLFPSATLWPERFGGMVKSWVAIQGFRHQEAVIAAFARSADLASPAPAGERVAA